MLLEKAAKGALRDVSEQCQLVNIVRKRHTISWMFHEKTDVRELSCDWKIHGKDNRRAERTNLVARWGGGDALDQKN